MGVALSWPAVSSGTAQGEAGGFALLEVAVPSLLTITVQDEEEPMGVIIGMDPHKRSATIEVVDERGTALSRGRFGTDEAGYAGMLAAGRRFTRSALEPVPRGSLGRLTLRSRVVLDNERPRRTCPGPLCVPLR